MNDNLKKFLERVTVVPDEEYQKNIREGAILVCILRGDVGSMPGNLTGVCGMCSREIEFRPYNAPAINKVCMECVLTLQTAGEA